MAKKVTTKEAAETAPEKKPAKKTTKKADEGTPTELKADNNETPETVTPQTKSKQSEPSTQSPEDTGSNPIAPEMIEEHIRVAAYYRWVERGMPMGASEEDWNEAEKQFRE